MDGGEEPPRSTDSLRGAVLHRKFLSVLVMRLSIGMGRADDRLIDSGIVLVCLRGRGRGTWEKRTVAGDVTLCR